jgi:hypothetical protein
LGYEEEKLFFPEELYVISALHINLPANYTTSQFLSCSKDRSQKNKRTKSD